jgi:hypothetical protein
MLRRLNRSLEPTSLGSTSFVRRALRVTARAT